MPQRLGRCLQYIGLGATCALLGASAGRAEEPFELILWLDHFDYTVGIPDPVEWSTMAPDGIDRIIAYHAPCGKPVVAYRDFAGALLRHNSKTELGQYPQRIDKRRTVDMRPGCTVVRYGEAPQDVMQSILNACEKRGLKPIIYWPFEDCHGSAVFYGRFALEHPEFWERDVDGHASPARLCLAYPEVRRYKLDILREEMDMGMRGVMFDFRRQSGLSSRGGYNEVMTEEFRRRHGKEPPNDPGEPEWIQFRASYVTQFLREVRTVLDSYDPPCELIAAIPDAGPDIDACRARYLTDWATWIDEGLLDGFAVSALSYDADRGIDSVVEAMESIAQVVGGRCKLHWPMKWYDQWTVQLAADSGLELKEALTRYVEAAWEAGAAGFVMDTYDYNMGGMTAETQAHLAHLFTERFAQMKATPIEPPAANAQPVPKPAGVRHSGAEEGSVQLTSGPHHDDEPAWSPDGKWIAFQSDRSGSLDIWLVPADGGEPRNLTNSPSNDCFPAWSPDGSKLAFASDRDGGEYDIFAMSASGRDVRQLTSGPERDYLPSWSPDGQHILFASTRGGGSGDIAICRVPVDGGEVELVFGVPRDVTLCAVEPSVSPDGRWMAFAEMRRAMENWSVAVCSAADVPWRRPVSLTEPNEYTYAPAFSPDGARLAWTSNRGGRYDIWIAPVTGDSAVRATTHTANDCNPTWSPDGTKIAFASDRAGSYDIWVLPALRIEVNAEELAAWRGKMDEFDRAAAKSWEEEKHVDQQHGLAHRSSQASAGWVHEVGQGFTVGRDGALFKLALCMTRDAGEKPLVVQLRTDDEGKPGSEVLASVEVAHTALPDTPRYDWVDVRFDPPVPVAAGTRYWIYLPLSGQYHWLVDARGRYQGGQAFSDKFGYGGYDWLFKTYVK